MTNIQQKLAAILFVSVMILGGWVWSQDAAVKSPSDGKLGSDVPTADSPAADSQKSDDTVTAAPDSDGPISDSLPVDTTQAEPPANDGAGQTETKAAPPTSESTRWQGMILSLWIFVLAVFLGIELISKVPPTLHTPLMSGSNAISGITLVGAVIVAAAVIGGLSPTPSIFARFLGFIAVTLAMINAVGGFLVTHRMLAMFTRK